MTICDVVANKALHEGEEEGDHEESELVQSCEQFQDKCKEIFSDQKDGVNKFNCLERYGYKPGMLSEKCLVQSSVTMPQFYYPLKNKYDCLADPKKATILDSTASECLNMFNEYTVENCLAQYEKDYNNKIGFYGGQPGTPDFYKYYGNTTASLEYKRQVAYNQVRALRDEQLTQVSILPENELSDIENYLCEYVTMFYHTNPYNDLALDPTSKQNNMNISLSCKVFDYIDMDQEEQYREQLVGIHHYFDKEIVIKGAEDITDAKLKDLLFINRTNYNEQYFKIEFEGDQLEFLQIKESVLYQSQLSADALDQDYAEVDS